MDGKSGEYGEREDLAINKNIVIIGWEDLPDLSTIHSREELVELYAKTYPDSKKMTAANQEDNCGVSSMKCK